jgi:pimeloyl-ACP methyl ester carboxylesterase
MNTPMGDSRFAKAADGTEIYFQSHGEQTKPAVFMGPHFYPSRSGDAGSFTRAWIERLRVDFFVIAADYPRGIGRTGNPQGLHFNADVAAEEYGRIADAAGVERFGWVGYSFGGALGVQIACRTGRVTALAVGGFPPLSAPFKLMTDISIRSAECPGVLPPFIDLGVLWSAVGFYKSLIGWPQRQEIPRLTMPRMIFMGDNDSAQGATETIPLAEILRTCEGDLRALGWGVSWLAGQDHESALQPTIALPIVHQFLREALLSR